MPTGVVRSCKRHWQFTRLRPFSTLTRAVNLRLTFSRLCCEKPRFIWHRPPGSMDGKGRAIDNIFTVRRCGRTALAGPPVRNGQIRRYLLEGLHRWLATGSRLEGILHVLQRETVSPGLGLSNAGSGLQGQTRSNKPSGNKNNYQFRYSIKWSAFRGAPYNVGRM